MTSDDEPSGSNHEITLNEARANYLRFGACEESLKLQTDNESPARA